MQVESEALTEQVNRLRRIEAVTDAGLAHLSVEELLVELLDRVCEMLSADTAAVLLLEPSGHYLVATAARGLEEEVRQGVRIPLGRGFAGRITARKEPVILERVDHVSVLNPILWEKGIRSLLGVPLVAGGAVIGVLHVGTLNSRRFGVEDSQLLQVVADRIALAVQSRQLGVERASAVTMQRTLLPAKLPTVPGIDLASRYVPGGGGDIGGDWYDVFELPSGEVCLVIGDVAGRGILAAAAMYRIRSALRAYALETADPATVVWKLDVNLRHFEPSLLATVLCALIQPTSGRIALSTAGHPPPVQVRPGRPGEVLDLPADLLLGVDPARPRHTTAVELMPGDGLLFYTDGMIEDRGVSIDVGLDRLCTVAHSGPAESVCARVMLEMVGDEEVDDDIALLMLRREGCGEPGPPPGRDSG